MDCFFVSVSLRKHPDFRGKAVGVAHAKGNKVDGTESWSEIASCSYEARECGVKNGMFVGNHGYEHYWMNKLTPEEQEYDIDLSLNFLDFLGVSSNDWMMCFPHGAYDESLLKILRQKGCTLAVTIKPGIADLSVENSLTLQRLDTNEFPKNNDAAPCSWTNQVIRGS